jgi:type III secretory pathway component EscR
MLGCKTQKHLQVETKTDVEQQIETTQETNKNTVKYITITKYVTVKDSTTGEYPIESITEITETNQDKITIKQQQNTNTTQQESIKEDSITEPSYNWKLLIYAYSAGILTILIIIGLIKLIKLYLKKKGV